MKSTFLLLLLASLPALLRAQKEGDTWMLGGSSSDYDSSVYKACRFHFDEDGYTLSLIPKTLSFDGTNSIISDPAGNLLCYSNGQKLFNKNHEVMQNGTPFFENADYAQGFPGRDAFILLPLPGHPDTVVQIYGEIALADLPEDVYLIYSLRYAYADMSVNGGLGKVVKKHIQVDSDTLMPGAITAVRHGNGRDWWVFANHFRDEVYYRYLLTPDGLQQVGKQAIPLKNIGLTQACFSPDGKWFARFSDHGLVPSPAYSTIELYHFDRCSGLLSDYTSKTYDLSGLNGKPGGAAFSPSSRYLYVSRWDTIFQYDTQAADIIASEQVVAVYDGFTGDYGLPTRFYTMQLAADGRIYCCVSNYNSRYLHVIEHPDSAGVACQVLQHDIHLPVFNFYLLPNIPYYRLYTDTGSPCDTLGIVPAPEPEKGPEILALSPNPTSAHFQIEYSAISPADAEARISDARGRLIHRQPLSQATTDLDAGSWPAGLYIVQIWQQGKLVAMQRLAIMR